MVIISSSCCLCVKQDQRGGGERGSWSSVSSQSMRRLVEQREFGLQHVDAARGIGAGEALAEGVVLIGGDGEPLEFRRLRGRHRIVGAGGEDGERFTACGRSGGHDSETTAALSSWFPAPPDAPAPAARPA